MNIGQRIKFYREKIGLSGRALALKTGLDPSQINKIEHGINKPSIDALERICSILGVSLSNFFAESSPDLSPELCQLLHEVKDLSPKQIKKLTEFINAMKE